MCGFSTSRQFLPGSCQRHERAFAALLAKKRSGANAVSASPCAPARQSWRGRGLQQCGCPGGGRSRSSVPCRSSGRAVPSQRRAREMCGQGRAEAFYREQRSSSVGSIHSPGAHLRGSGLISAPRNQRSPLGLREQSCSRSGHFTPNTCKAKCVRGIKQRSFNANLAQE